MTFIPPKFQTYGENLYIAPQGSYYPTQSLYLGYTPTGDTGGCMHFSRFYAPEDITVTSLSTMLTAPAPGLNTGTFRIDLGIFGSVAPYTIGYLLGSTGQINYQTTYTAASGSTGSSSFTITVPNTHRGQDISIGSYLSGTGVAANSRVTSVSTWPNSGSSGTVTIGVSPNLSGSVTNNSIRFFNVLISANLGSGYRPLSTDGYYKGYNSPSTAVTSVKLKAGETYYLGVISDTDPYIAASGGGINSGGSETSNSYANLIYGDATDFKNKWPYGVIALSDQFITLGGNGGEGFANTIFKYGPTWSAILGNIDQSIPSTSLGPNYFLSMHSVEGWPSDIGYFQVDDEIFYYNGIIGNQLMFVAGAQYGTTRAAHNANAKAYLLTILKTQINSGASPTTIDLNHTNGWPKNGGKVTIGSATFTYTGISGTSLTGVSGTNSTGSNLTVGTSVTLTGPNVSTESYSTKYVPFGRFLTLSTTLINDHQDYGSDVGAFAGPIIKIN